MNVVDGHTQVKINQCCVICVNRVYTPWFTGTTAYVRREEDQDFKGMHQCNIGMCVGK